MMAWEMKRDDYIKMEIENDIKLRSYTPEDEKRNKRIFNSRTFKQHYAEFHRKWVELALKEGKSIPSDVLDDYPDLARKYANYTPPRPIIRDYGDMKITIAHRQVDIEAGNYKIRFFKAKPKGGIFNYTSSIKTDEEWLAIPIGKFYHID